MAALSERIYCVKMLWPLLLVLLWLPPDAATAASAFGSKSLMTELVTDFPPPTRPTA
jgi:hypothetical protein